MSYLAGTSKPSFEILGPCLPHYHLLNQQNANPHTRHEVSILYALWYCPRLQASQDLWLCLLSLPKALLIKQVQSSFSRMHIPKLFIK